MNFLGKCHIHSVSLLYLMPALEQVEEMGKIRKEHSQEVVGSSGSSSGLPGSLVAAEVRTSSPNTHNGPLLLGSV